MSKSPYNDIPESAADWQVTKERRRYMTFREPALHKKGYEWKQ